jgi:hypothetical protein
MHKENILGILKGYKRLAVIDFGQISEEETEETKEYQKGYLDALDMIYEQFEKNL